MDHGHPVAWNTGPPFGIVMQCSESDFLSLCLSFINNAIIMDEDLQVNRIISKCYFYDQRHMHGGEQVYPSILKLLFQCFNKKKNEPNIKAE